MALQYPFILPGKMKPECSRKNLAQEGGDTNLPERDTNDL